MCWLLICAFWLYEDCCYKNCFPAHWRQCCYTCFPPCFFTFYSNAGKYFFPPCLLTFYTNDQSLFPFLKSWFLKLFLYMHIYVVGSSLIQGLSKNHPWANIMWNRVSVHHLFKDYPTGMSFYNVKEVVGLSDYPKTILGFIQMWRHDRLAHLSFNDCPKTIQ